MNAHRTLLPRLNGKGRTLVGKWVQLTNKNRAHSPTATYKYNRHNDYGEYTYDAVMLLDKVLTDLKGDTDPEKLTQALNSVSSFQSIRGEVRIDPDSHGLIQTYYHTAPVVDGDSVKIKVVEPLGVFGPTKQIS